MWIFNKKSGFLTKNGDFWRKCRWLAAAMAETVDFWQYKIFTWNRNYGKIVFFSKFKLIAKKIIT